MSVCMVVAHKTLDGSHVVLRAHDRQDLALGVARLWLSTSIAMKVALL